MNDSHEKLILSNGTKQLDVEEKLSFGRTGGGYDFEIEGDSVGAPHAVVERNASGYLIRAATPGCDLWVKEGEKRQKTDQVILKDRVTFEIGDQEFSCKTGQEDTKPPPPPPRDHDQGLQPFFKEKVYRIGIIGGPGSGKTCFMTALAMSRRPHPLGHSCTQLRKLDPEAEGLNKISRERKARLERDFSEGYQRIKNSKRWLFEGKVPEKSSLEILRMAFHFSDGLSKESRTIEFIDYAGEMLGEESGHDGTPVSQKLFNILNEVDAFIILAETPMPDENGEFFFNLPHTEVLRQIKQIFLELDPSKIDRARPMAILMNKWDRFRDLSGATFAEECQKLEAWAKTPNGQALLELKQALSGIAKHPVSIFPTSAFGESEIVQSDAQGNRIERPVIHNNLLPSFGMEDVLAQMVDDVLTEFRKQANLRMDRIRGEFQNLPKILASEADDDQAKQLKSEVEAFRDEIRSHSGMAGMLPEVVDELDGADSTIGRRLKFGELVSLVRKKAVPYGIAAVLLLTLVFAVGGFYKKRTYVEPVSAAAEVLAEYVNQASPGVPEKSHWDAAKTLNSEFSSFQTIWPWPGDPVDDDHREASRTKFHRTGLDAVKRALAADPRNPENMDHIHAISSFRTGKDTDDGELKQNLRAEWLEMLRAVGEALAGWRPDLDDYDSWKDVLEQHFPQEFRQPDWIALNERIKEALKLIKEQKEWMAFLKELGKRDFDAASKRIQSVFQNSEGVPDATRKDAMREQLKATLLVTVNGVLKTATFSEGQKSLQDIRKRFADHPHWKWTEPEWQKAMSMLERAKEDWTAYETFRNSPSESSANKYLKDLPEPFMEKQIKRWLKTDFKAKLRAKLAWRGVGKGLKKDEIEKFKIRVNGKDFGDLKAKPGTWGSVGRKKMFRDTEKIKIRFILKYDKGLIHREKTIKSGSKKVTVKELRNGPHYSMVAQGAKVYFQLKEPEFIRNPDPWTAEYREF